MAMWVSERTEWSTKKGERKEEEGKHQDQEGKPPLHTTFKSSTPTFHRSISLQTQP